MSVLLVVQCAVQNGAPEARHAFLPNTVYTYDYTSEASVYHGVEFTVQSEVREGVVKTEGCGGQLLLSYCSQARVGKLFVCLVIKIILCLASIRYAYILLVKMECCYYKINCGMFDAQDKL